MHHRSGHHLEKNVKTGKSRRRPRIVLSEDEDAAEDSSKQGRKISDIDTYPIISLVQPHQDMEDIEYDFDGTASIPVTTAGLKISTTNIAVSTDDAAVTTASASISTVSPPRVSTTEYISGAETLVYHALQNRPYSVAEVRKNMCMYLKNQGRYKMSHFKGMSYQEIRPIFERVWDQIQSFIPMDSEKEKGSEKKGSRKKTFARKRASEKQSDESAKRQNQKDDAEKEDLKEYLNIVPEDGINIEALQTMYPLIDWEIYTEDSRVYWKIIRVVHHVSTEKGLHMFMLVEKDYPLTRGLPMLMLVSKLQVDQHSELADELLRKIFEIANRPRK
ncbi:hypothetical protein Tco_0004869 [Tanacetum coccineum]